LFASSEGLGPRELRELYDRNFTMLFRVAWRIVGDEGSAEDIVHDSFARLVEKRIPFPSPDDAKFWLIRVVKNNALNVAKRRGREARAYERYWRESRDDSESAEAAAIKAEAGAEVKAMLARLPEKLRAVLVLKEYALLSYREIGRVLGITEGNVKVRVFRAREALLSLMTEDGHGAS